MLPLIALLSLAEGPVFRTSTVDVTPEEALPLGGYTARGDKKMEDGGDRLFARTLVFEHLDLRIAIVSLESLTIPESLYESVKKRLPNGVELMLVATHTHSAPDSQMLNERMTFKIPGIASFSRRWLDWYADRVSRGVLDALAAEASGAKALSLATAEVDANRGRRTGAVPIKTATYLVAEGRPLLTGYAAHATVLDEAWLKTSGDWPGALAKRAGGLVLPGPIGDVSPATAGSDQVENMASVVEKLTSGLASARVMDLFDTGAPLAWTTEAVALDKPVPHPDFNKSFGATPPLDQVLISRFAPPSASVFLARIGRLLIIGVPGEPTSEVGRRLLAVADRNGYPHALVVSHTNGWIGYILTPEDYDRGGYEATLSFNGRQTSERVVEAVERAAKRLAQAAPRVAHRR